MGGVVKGLGALYASVQATVGALREWLDATVALDRLRRVLTTVTGSAAEADKQIEFLRNTAQKTGQNFTQISGEYGKFVASAAASGIPLATVQKVFVGVSAAAGQLGLSSERTSLILGALGQMASKGTVGMEELRQQLGDSLPGALSLLAKGLGLADADLIKLVESGGLLARDALPALGTALTQFASKGGEVDGLTASWNRFKNIVLEAGTTLAEGPIGRAAAVVLVALAGVLRDVTVVAVGASEAFNVVGRTLALVVAALTGNISSFKAFREEFDQILLDSGSKIDQFKSRAYASADATKAMGTAATATAPAITAQGAALQRTGAAAQGAAAAQTQAAQATTAASVAAQGAAAAQTQAAQATAAAGAVAVATGTQWYSLKVAYDANITSIEKTAKIATVVAVGASEAFNVVGRTLALVVAALTGNISSFKAFREEFDQILLDSGSKIDQFKSRAYASADATKAMGTAATATAPAITAQGAALQRTGAAAQGAAAAQTQAAQATTAASVAAQGAAAAQTQAAQATAAAGAVAVATGTQWYSLKVAYDANITSIEKTAKIAGELVKAKQEEGKAAESLAKLTGNENEIRVVAAKVAADNAAAVRDEADAVATHAAVLAAEHAALLATAKAENDLNDDRKKQLATLQDLIDKTSAEAEKLNQTARAQELASVAAKQAVEIAKDNTFRHGEFAIAVDKARVALQAITIEMKAGRASSDDYERATLNLKNAQGLLRDSVLDADNYLKRYLDSKKADTDITINGLRLKLEEARTLERFAVLHGLETQALQAKITQKQLELDIARATAKAKADEADETIRLTLQTLAELRATGDLTPEKQYELDLRVQNARAKKLEAAAGLEASKSISEEIAALRGLAAAKREANAVPTPTGAPLVNAPAAKIGPVEETLNPGDYRGADGKLRNSSGEVIGSIKGSYDIGATAALQIKERNGTLSASDLALAQTAADTAQFNATVAGKSGLFSLDGQRDAIAQVRITQRLLEQVKYLVDAAKTPSSGGTNRLGTAIPTTGLLTNNGIAFDPNATAVGVGQSTSHTVTINLPGGRSSTIAVSSALDGTALANLIKQLEHDLARAGG